jgi:hypothetical protein
MIIDCILCRVDLLLILSSCIVVCFSHVLAHVCHQVLSGREEDGKAFITCRRGQDTTFSLVSCEAVTGSRSSKGSMGVDINTVGVNMEDTKRQSCSGVSVNSRYVYAMLCCI